MCRNRCLRRDTEQQKGKTMWVWRLLSAKMKKRSREEHMGAQGKRRIKAKCTTAKEGSFDFDARRWTKKHGLHRARREVGKIKRSEVE